MNRKECFTRLIKDQLIPMNTIMVTLNSTNKEEFALELKLLSAHLSETHRLIISALEEMVNRPSAWNDQ